MTLARRFRRALDGLPPGSSVVLPVDLLQTWIELEDTSEVESDLTGKDVAQRFARVPCTVRAWIQPRARGPRTVRQVRQRVAALVCQTQPSSGRGGATVLAQSRRTRTSVQQ